MDSEIGSSRLRGRGRATPCSLDLVAPSGAYSWGVRLLESEPQLRSVDTVLAVGALCGASSAALNSLTGWSCPVAAATGWLCPFCGGTRAVEALWNLQFVGALHANGLVVLVLGFVGARLLIRSLGQRQLITRVDWWLRRVNLQVWAGSLVVWMLARNLVGPAVLGPPVGR